MYRNKNLLQYINEEHQVSIYGLYRSCCGIYPLFKREWVGRGCRITLLIVGKQVKGALRTRRLLFLLYSSSSSKSISIVI